MIFKPKRGKTSTMNNSNIVLAAGELFAEIPDTGVGTGKGRLVMGDGTTVYSELPSFIENTDVSTANITIVTDTSSTSTNALNNVVSNTSTGSLIGSLKQAISLTKSEITNSVNSSLYTTGADTGTKFYFDYQNNQYGYNTSSSRGADTFHPFKTTHTNTYTYPANSTGETYDLGESHEYRYVNAANVYAKGKADAGGDTKHSVKVSYNHYTGTAGMDVIIFYCYVDGTLVSNPSFNSSDENRVITAWTRTV